MVHCLAFNCKNGSYQNQSKDRNVVFFSFPNDNDFRKIWIENVRLKHRTPSKSLKLCLSHYEALCFTQDLGVLEAIGWTASRLRLKHDTVPTIFNHSSSEEGIKRKLPQKRKEYAKRQRREVSCVLWMDFIFAIRVRLIWYNIALYYFSWSISY